jgi:hypothetical protein
VPTWRAALQHNFTSQSCATRVTLDLAVVSRGSGLLPGQAAVRGSGTRFCLSGPFPDGFNIEQINGVVVSFQAQEGGPLIDVWDNAQRIIPLFP